MAIPFLNNINLNDNQLLNAKLHVTSSAPTAAAGQIYFDSTQSPDAVDTVKYYANSTDTWVSLKEYSFPAVAQADGYITSTITGTTAKPIVKFNLNATGTADSTTYLRGDNQWEPISAIPGTYEFTISDNASPTPSSAIVEEADTLIIAATADLTSNLTTPSVTEKLLTIGLKVDGGVGVVDNYIVNQGTATASADDTIPFNNYTNNGSPTLDTDIVKKTTFGTIPVDALTLVKQYIDNSVAGGLIYQGGYDASTDTTSPGGYGLQTPPSPNIIEKGWTYTVTADGTFFAEQVRTGDVLIAEVDAPTALTDWTTVQNNIDLASLTQVGIGNVIAATAAALDGLSVTYSNGTATVGLDINSLTLSLPQAGNEDAYLPYLDDDASTNKKITFAQLSTQINADTSFSGTIGNGSATSIILEDSGAVAPNINHGLGTDSSSFMIQLVDVSSGETVYTDVTRGSGGQVTIDFAVAPAIAGIRVLIQKIG